MLDLNLSKEAEALLCRMYQRYLLCREAGDCLRIARQMGDSDLVHARFCADDPLEDTIELCFALSGEGLLNLIEGSGAFLDSELTEKAISIMESRFKKNLSAILTHLENLLGLIR